VPSAIAVLWRGPVSGTLGVTTQESTGCAMISIVKDKARVLTEIKEQLASVAATVKVAPGGRQCDVNGQRIPIEDAPHMLQQKLSVLAHHRVRVLIEGPDIGLTDHLDLLQVLKDSGYSNLIVWKVGTIVEKDRARGDA
jgi:hypothetical protein